MKRQTRASQAEVTRRRFLQALGVDGAALGGSIAAKQAAASPRAPHRPRCPVHRGSSADFMLRFEKSFAVFRRAGVLRGIARNAHNDCCRPVTRSNLFGCARR